MAIYYESSWSILSTIGLVNFFFAWIVIGITRLSWLSAIPAIVSAAGAVANGLCYYAWYMKSGKPRTATAYAVADILWMVSWRLRIFTRQDE
jgi:antibiotic biosynthesis monooxygenase (ABM) superfamily enzyme